MRVAVNFKISAMRYLFFILLLANFNGNAQELNETVDYINNLLKLHTHNLHIPELENGSRGFDKITIDAHGRINVQRYVEDEKTGTILSKGQTGYAYLKFLELGTKKDLNGPPTEYKLGLQCHSLGNCVTYQFNNEGSRTQSELWFSVDNYDIRERLQKALLHLLELAKTNKDFYEKDPFTSN